MLSSHLDVSVSKFKSRSTLRDAGEGSAGTSAADLGFCPGVVDLCELSTAAPEWTAELTSIIFVAVSSLPC